MSQAEQNAEREEREREREREAVDGLLVPSVGCSASDGFQGCVRFLL